MQLTDLSADRVLEDERVLLRPLVATDHAHLLPFSLNELELWRFSMVQAAGAEGLARYIELALEGRRQGREYPFIVFDKRTGNYVGSTRFYDIQPANRALQLGYTWYGRQAQGTGLNAHCKFLLLGLAFEELGVERVEFRADARNARSIAAMKGIGCTVEGILRSTGPTPEGVRRDSIVLSILKEEWSSRVRAQLEARLRADEVAGT